MSVSRKQPHLKIRVRSSVARQFRHAVQRLAQRRTRKRLGGLLLAIGILIMLAWNPKLVLATSAGIGLMWLVYGGLGWNWRLQWARWQPFFQGSGGKLTLAAGSGGLAAIGTYLVASIWADAENRWLATGTILQGMATLSTLAIVLWQTLTAQRQDHATQFEHWLGELTAQDSLKRFIAVRQLTNLVSEGGLPSSDQHQLRDYFRLMLGKETDDTVRDALLASLGQLSVNPPLEPIGKPLQIPLTVKRSLYRQI